MAIKHRIMIGIPEETHKQLEEIKSYLDKRSFVWIVTRAIRNYYKATIGNSKK